MSIFIYFNPIISFEFKISYFIKFFDILDKNQLQRFLGSLNYVEDFYPNLIILIKPLFQRLKKSPNPWSDEHIQIVK